MGDEPAMRRSTLTPVGLRLYRGTETILLAEPEPLLGDVFERVLMRQGFAVLVANDSLAPSGSATTTPVPSTCC